MRRPESVVYLRDPLLVAAEAVYQHAILTDFQGETISPSKLAKVFLASWDSLQGQIPPKVFKTRRALATLVVDRAAGLLQQYRAVRPVTPYARILGTSSATGQYAVLEQRNAAQPIWYALRLRSTTEGIPTPPRSDVVSLLRWLHLRSSEDERRHVRVLNCYLQSLITCEQSFPCERSIRNGLTLLLSNVVSGHEFPSPGDYCLDCQSEACQ